MQTAVGKRNGRIYTNIVLYCMKTIKQYGAWYDYKEEFLHGDRVDFNFNFGILI